MRTTLAVSTPAGRLVVWLPKKPKPYLTTSLDPPSVKRKVISWPTVYGPSGVTVRPGGLGRPMSPVNSHFLDQVEYAVPSNTRAYQL